MAQDFKRARSAEQKGMRMADIKQATAQLYRECPYHEITLTTIAERLGWSRASLYKYVTTKEEIFLELCADARQAYFDALLAAFPENSNPTHAETAKLWAHAAHENRDWFIYGNLLLTIIETNVTLDRLKVFKKAYYDHFDILSQRMCAVLKMQPERFGVMQEAIKNEACGLCGICSNNPLIEKALHELGICRKLPEFLPTLEEFIAMCLDHYAS